MLYYIQVVLTSLVLQNVRVVIQSLTLLLSLEQRKREIKALIIISYITFFITETVKVIITQN